MIEHHFMTISSDELKIISMCEIVKEFYDILDVKHEGIKMFKNSKF